MSNHPWVIVAGSVHAYGGMDKANLVLTQHLTSQGIPVHLVTHSAEHSLYSNPLVTIYRVHKPLNSFLLGEPFLDFLGRRVANAVTSRNPLSTVVINGSNCGWPGINWAHYIHHAWKPVRRERLNLSAGVRFVVNRLEKIQERAAYRKARLILANSDLTLRHIVNYFGVNPDRVKTLYLGSDPAWTTVSPADRKSARDHFQIPKSRFCAAFVGALGSDDRKGADILFAAWKRLCEDKQWDVDLFVAGDGRTLSRWRTTITSWGLQNRIKLLGFCNNIRELLAASDLLVSPSRYEAYGLNVQEAICRGIPSIASSSSGIAERYPDSLRPFLLPDPEDIDDLIRRLRTWRRNVPMWKNNFEPFGMALRSHTWQDMARKFVALVGEAQSTVRLHN